MLRRRTGHDGLHTGFWFRVSSRSEPGDLHRTRRAPAGRELFVVRDRDNPDTTHFLQLEDPETCAALTLDFLEEQGVA